LNWIDNYMASEDETQYDATQTAILDAVVACIIGYGFKGLTTRRIAEMAGVNEVTIFRRFGSKNALINAAFERDAGAMHRRLPAYSGDLEADLVQFVSSFLELGKGRISLLPVILTELPHNPELQAAIGNQQRVMGEVMTLLLRYQTEGKLRPEPPAITFAALIGPLIFALLSSGLSMPMLDQLEPKAYVRCFLEGRGIASS
jgi:AcrR family transcriptional regulator